MNYLINYANETYRKTQKLNTWTGKHFGKFDKVIEYSDKDIDEDFYYANKRILDKKRGNGLWLWKPYIIKRTMDLVNEGDVVFYCDSGACFIRSAVPILKILKKQDIWVSVLPLLDKQFTKRMTFEILNCDEEKYKNTPQISGTFFAARKSAYSMEFVNQWLNYCCNYEAISPDISSSEYDYFISHREDQSILSLLVKKHGIVPYQDPTQFGVLPEKYNRPNCEMVYYKTKDYPACILHHRTKDANKKVLIRQLLCAVLPRKIGLKLISNH